MATSLKKISMETYAIPAIPVQVGVLCVKHYEKMLVVN